MNCSLSTLVKGWIRCQDLRICLCRIGWVAGAPEARLDCLWPAPLYRQRIGLSALGGLHVLKLWWGSTSSQPTSTLPYEYYIDIQSRSAQIMSVDALRFYDGRNRDEQLKPEREQYIHYYKLLLPLSSAGLAKRTKLRLVLPETSSANGDVIVPRRWLRVVIQWDESTKMYGVSSVPPRRLCVPRPQF